MGFHPRDEARIAFLTGLAALLRIVMANVSAKRDAFEAMVRLP